MGCSSCGSKVSTQSNNQTQQKVAQQAAQQKEQAQIQTNAKSVPPIPQSPDYVKDIRSKQLAVTQDKEKDTVTLTLFINGMKPGTGLGEYNPVYFEFIFSVLTPPLQEIRVNDWSRTYPAKPHHQIKLVVKRKADNHVVATEIYMIPPK